MADALLILAPLFLGFMIHLNNPRVLGWINELVEWLVYLILSYEVCKQICSWNTF